MAGSDGEDLAELWRAVDDLSDDLPPADRRAVRDAIANSVLEGHHPTAGEIARLVAFATGRVSMAAYLTHMTQTAHRERF